MAQLITAIQDYAAWLYVLLGLLMVRELVAMYRSGRDRRQAMFSLEREAAIGRATRSVVMLLLLAIIGAGIYGVARVVAPALPERERLMVDEAPIVETPRPIDMPRDTPLPVPQATATPRPQRIVTAAPSAEAPLTLQAQPALCRNPNVDIVAPSSGALLTAELAVIVTARFDPAQGRTYSLEIGEGAAPDRWTVLAGPLAEPVEAEGLVVLSPQGLPAGIYTLRLSLALADGTVPAGDACAVAIRVP